MKIIRLRQAGVTLLETLFVMVIFSMLIVMAVNYVQQKATNQRMDRTALQMQQIMNAALSYYVNNGKWPSSADLSGLQPDYLANDTGTSPWGTNYTIGYTDSGTFYVWVGVRGSDATTAAAMATTIAGRLPFGYISTAEDAVGGPLATVPSVDNVCSGESVTTCSAVSYVNVPGQNLNNASAVNFAGLYHHGACVPVPKCPVDREGNTMTPQIMLVPVSVSGVNDEGSSDVYPISSFTAYATGNDPLDTSPPFCEGATTPEVTYYSGGIKTETTSSCANLVTSGETDTTSYWRACLQVITERGDVQITRSDAWGEHVTLMAITRCSISDEPSGSPFTVYGN